MVDASFFPIFMIKFGDLDVFNPSPFQYFTMCEKVWKSWSRPIRQVGLAMVLWLKGKQRHIMKQPNFVAMYFQIYFIISVAS